MTKVSRLWPDRVLGAAALPTFCVDSRPVARRALLAPSPPAVLAGVFARQLHLLSRRRLLAPLEESALHEAHRRSRECKGPATSMNEVKGARCCWASNVGCDISPEHQTAGPQWGHIRHMSWTRGPCKLAEEHAGVSRVRSREKEGCSEIPKQNTHEVAESLMSGRRPIKRRGLGWHAAATCKSEGDGSRCRSRRRDWKTFSILT